MHCSKHVVVITLSRAPTMSPKPSRATMMDDSVSGSEVPAASTTRPMMYDPMLSTQPRCRANVTVAHDRSQIARMHTTNDTQYMCDVAYHVSTCCLLNLPRNHLVSVISVVCSGNVVLW